MRNRLLLASASLPILLGALLLIFPIGCGSSEKTKSTTTEKKVQEDPWLRVATTLRQETDTGSVQRVLNELNQALASAPVDSQRKLSDADAAYIQSALNLNEAEMKEVRSGGYTALDPNHLAEALYLRDVARSLDIDKLPMGERAAAAFQWVCRQVILQPWVAQTSANRGERYPPLPPTFVLRRGTGSGLERIFVFVALCRQLEIDAYPIGPAAAAGQPVLYQQPGKETEFPRGPFWGVGIRDRSDILLFDPLKAQPLPGKNGRPATLADVRANPRELAIWLDNKEFAWAVTADDLKAGEIYIIASQSSVAPRNKTLEEKLAADIGAKLSVNLADAKKTAEIAAKGVPVRFYSPAGEAFSPTRALASLLPTAEGGTAVETVEQPGSLYGNFLRAQIPGKGQLYSVPQGLDSADAKGRLFQMAASDFASAFCVPPTPLEKLQRGQFAEVTKALVRLRDHYAALDALKRGEDQAAAREWVERIDALSTEFTFAKPDEQPAIRARINELWKSPVVGSLVGGAVAQPGIAEATYLLALTKHEQAERAWAKARYLSAAPDTDPAKKGLAQAQAASLDAWTDARDWWGRYEPLAASQRENYPGRADLAKRLTARANELAGGK